MIQKQLDDERAKNKRLEEEIENLKKKYHEAIKEINKLKIIIQNLTKQKINLKNPKK